MWLLNHFKGGKENLEPMISDSMPTIVTLNNREATTEMLMFQTVPTAGATLRAPNLYKTYGL